MNSLVKKLFLSLVGIHVFALSSAQIPYNLTPVRPSYEGSFFYPDTVPNAGRLRLTGGLVVGAYAVAYTGLAAAWYKDVPKSEFHFFDDSGEWQQMDKVGHAFGAYQGSRGMIQLLKWGGMKKKSVVLLGGMTGFVMQAPIEILDGYSAKWGASWTDLAANFGGAALATANEALWSEQRVQMKWSWHHTSYADHFPELFGSGSSEFLKDYNGQTYWLSWRVNSFLPEGKMKEIWPRWLNVATGYGADGMVGGYGRDPQALIDQREWRQYYLSLDIDLSQIETNSGALDMILGVLSFVKVPAPAIEFSRGGVNVYGLYY